jgi:hypothetical protein
MVSVVEELKAKLSELDARIEAAKAEIAILEVQRSTVQTVIGVFDPKAASPALPKARSADRSTPGRRVTDLLKGRNVRGGVLDILREAEESILAGDLAERFLKREEVETPIDGIGPNLAGRFAGLLDRMAESGIVRSLPAPDGRRRLWEIAR